MKQQLNSLNGAIMTKICLKYDPIDGISMPDGMVQGYVSKLIEDYKMGNLEVISVSFGTAIFFNVFRYHIVTGDFNYQDITLEDDGKVFSFNKYGRFGAKLSGDYLGASIRNYLFESTKLECADYRAKREVKLVD
jgi:hypothetical protein